MKTTDTMATAKQPTTSTTTRCQPSLHDKFPSNPLDETAGFVDYDKKAALWKHSVFQPIQLTSTRKLTKVILTHHSL